jgi:pimeloyl-ACP methyl ester carboxylesterase
MFVVVLLFNMSNALNAAEKKIDEDTLAAMKQTRDLSGETWGPPLEQGVTQDGFQLTATFFPGNVNKDTIPVVLFHGNDGDRSDFTMLANKMSSNGLAVLAPDLRGHGKSIKRYVFDELKNPQPQQDWQPPQQERNRRFVGKGGNNRNDDNMPPEQEPIVVPKLVTIKAEDLLPQDYDAMTMFDIPLFNRYMRVQNDGGYLNMNKLVVIGSDIGAALATYWAIRDWGRGADHHTKMLVLINPAPLRSDQNFVLYFKEASKNFKDNVKVMIITSANNPNGMQLAAKIKEALLTPKELTADADKTGIESRLPTITVESAEKGAALLNDDKAGVTNLVIDFLTDRFSKYKEKDNKWTRAK